MTLEFIDKTISYNTFIEDLAERIANKIQRNAKDPEFVNQRTAYKIFGRANVDRWRRTGKVQPCKRPGTVQYRMTDLRTLQSTIQDYLIK